MTAPGTIRTRRQHTDRDRTTVTGRGAADRSDVGTRPARSGLRTAERTRRGSDAGASRTLRTNRTNTVEPVSYTHLTLPTICSV